MQDDERGRSAASVGAPTGPGGRSKSGGGAAELEPSVARMDRIVAGTVVIWTLILMIETIAMDPANMVGTVHFFAAQVVFGLTVLCALPLYLSKAYGALTCGAIAAFFGVPFISHAIRYQQALPAYPCSPLLFAVLYCMWRVAHGIRRWARLRAERGELAAAPVQCPSPPPILPAEEPPSSAAPSSVVDDLAKLSDLRERGLVTEEEFIKAKAVLLGESHG